MSAKTKAFLMGLTVGFVASWAWHNSMTGPGPNSRPVGQ